MQTHSDDNRRLINNLHLKFKRLFQYVRSVKIHQSVQEAKMHKRFGKASYYNLPGNRMANGQMFDASSMNAAMLHVPLGMVVQVKNIMTGKSISVTVTDRGPYPPGRVIDLPKAAFTALAGGTGVGLVEVEVDVP